MKKTSSISDFSPIAIPSQSLIEVGDWFVHTLAACGIDQSFGYPGAAIEPLYNALSRAQKCDVPIDVVTTKHESAAVYAAEGYYRVTQNIALCCATAGPGAANLVAGLASTAVERIPILVISGNPSVKDFGRGTFQDSSAAGNDIDTVSLLSNVCELSALVTHPAQLPHLLFKALSIVFGESPGPVHLSIPLDIFRAHIDEIEFNFPNPQAFQHSLPQCSRGLNENIMQDIIKSLLPQKKAQESQERQKVSKACLVIGGGCRDIASDLLRIATHLEWNIIATPTGKGLINHDHPYFCGVIGLGGHPLAYETLSAPNQKVIIIGTRFDESETGGWFAGSLHYKNTIQIDSNPDNLFCYFPAHIRYICDLTLFTHALENALFPHAPLSLKIPEHKTKEGRSHYLLKKHWELMQNKSTLDDACIKPQAFMGKLKELTPATTHICSDSGSAFMWTMHLWQSLPSFDEINPNHFHVAMGLGMMGWSPGASIGVAQALKKAGDLSPCICLVGDGSYLMSSQEIGSAVQNSLNIAFFIVNNTSLGIVEHCQRILGAEPIAYEMPSTDFAKNAAAFDIPSFRITHTQALEEGWKIFQKTPGPALFDLIIDHDELPPLGYRLEVLGFTKKRNGEDKNG